MTDFTPSRDLIDTALSQPMALRLAVYRAAACDRGDAARPSVV